MKSKIAIEGMEFYSFHGFYKEEQIIGGRYIVDAYISYDPGDDWLSDELASTINYEKIYELVKEEMALPSKLIETVCRRIFDRILSNTQTLIKKELIVKVKVTKYSPPVKGIVNNVFVEIEG